jgi:flavin reductase (DIM6/NTAB) family NADH-FMN oxidoreductase RutF
MSAPTYLPILGRIPSGVFILTVRHGSRETGMLTSWIQQAGFEPPMVSVALRQGRYLTEWLLEKAPFALNFIRSDQMNLLKHFGKGFEPDENAFDGLEMHADSRGVPILADSLGHLECEVASHIDSGDHRIFLAHIAGGRFSGDGQPLVHIRKNGSHY